MGIAFGFFLFIGTVSNTASAWNTSRPALNSSISYDYQVVIKGDGSGFTPFRSAENGLSLYVGSATMRPDAANTTAGFGLSGRDGSEPYAPEPSITVAEARVAMDRAESLTAGGKFAEALLWLRVAERALPRLTDRFAYKRGQLLMWMERPVEACQAYEGALESPRRDLAALAKVGKVQCALAAGDSKSEKLYAKLFQQYPKLPMAADILLERAKAREKRGDRAGAIALYQHLDLLFPSYPAAVQARVEIEKARKEGSRFREFTVKERLDRVERMIGFGSIAMAREEIEPLLGIKGQDENFQYRLRRAASRAGAVDAAANTVRSSTVSPSQGDSTAAAVPPSAGSQEASDQERARRLALSRVRQVQGDSPIRRLDFSKLVAVLGIAVQNQLAETADEALNAMSARLRSPAKARFDAAMLATGVASDQSVAALLRTLTTTPGFRTAASYHCARALERLGQVNEAEPLYHAILDLESDRTRYYAMWSEQRLAEIASERQNCCAPVGTVSNVHPGPVGDWRAHANPDTKESPVVAAVLRMIGAPALALSGRPGIIGTLENHPAPNALETDKVAKSLIERLSDFSDRHGAAYPWFGRAADLIALGEYTEAADELYDAYLAWRDANGSPRLRAGLETLFIGAAPPRRYPLPALRKARLALNRTDRAAMAEMAVSLGDMGLAFRLGGWDRVGWPRPYFSKAKQAARKYGIDPSLLYAVMRVESLYDHRIVSTAGAVGLMQIMPGTGRMIADSLAISDYNPTDLFDPETALEFSAQHLAYLIDNFQGRTPLAIAAYNAGAHNVRRWMRRAGGNAPVDVFLERIPFRETYNYVRRVLGNYAIYRAQQGLPMERLDTRMPPY
jgi:soluble lytic murein transglycosylase